MIGRPVGETGRKHKDVRVISRCRVPGDEFGEDDEEGEEDLGRVLHSFRAIPFNVSIAFSASSAVTFVAPVIRLRGVGTAGKARCFAFNPPNQHSPPARENISRENPAAGSEVNIAWQTLSCCCSGGMGVQDGDLKRMEYPASGLTRGTRWAVGKSVRKI